MGIKQDVLDWFLAHPDKRVNNESLRAAIHTDDAQQVSVALNALHNEVSLKREKIEGERGFTYSLSMDAAAELQADQVIAGTKPAKKKTKAGPGPKQSRVAKPPKEKKAKRKYKKRTPPQAPSPAPDPDPPANGSPGSAVFAIRQDGELGIDNGGKVVALPKSEVQRMQAFLKTVSPLWN